MACNGYGPVGQGASRDWEKWRNFSIRVESNQSWMIAHQFTHAFGLFFHPLFEHHFPADATDSNGQVRCWESIHRKREVFGADSGGPLHRDGASA